MDDGAAGYNPHQISITCKDLYPSRGLGNIHTHPRQEPKEVIIALAGVAQWTEHWLVNQRVAGLILSQGTCLGCGPGPQLGGA